jgi:HAD superfamily hydrolase (TIGR01509 family)
VTALVFDCDGVLAETERDGHLPAFNRTFARFGVPVRWSEEDYGRLLAAGGGGKERMATVFDDPSVVRRAGLPAAEAERRARVRRWHEHKTELFTGIVDAGELPPRPGVARIAGAALAAGWRLAVASTSAERSVRRVLDHVLDAEVAAAFEVCAGDIVPAKKPDPAIYRIALERLGEPPDRVLAIEDSRPGLLAAVGAGLRCVVTVSHFTAGERFDEAVLVVSSLGDPGRERTRVVANRGKARPADWLSLSDLEDCLA